jgi:hypothetical protein
MKSRHLPNTSAIYASVFYGVKSLSNACVLDTKGNETINSTTTEMTTDTYILNPYTLYVQILKPNANLALVISFSLQRPIVNEKKRYRKNLPSSYQSLYRVIQKESQYFFKVIVSVIVRK